MAKSIYEQHDSAFAQVSAFVVVKDGERVATVAFKFPKDGAGRLYAYVHWLGLPMVRGFADGYGYDKKSAAVESAINKGKAAFDDASQDPQQISDANSRALHSLRLAILTGGEGKYWNRRLEDAGFQVWQAV